MSEFLKSLRAFLAEYDPKDKRAPSSGEVWNARREGYIGCANWFMLQAQKRAIKPDPRSVTQFAPFVEVAELENLFKDEEQLRKEADPQKSQREELPPRPKWVGLDLAPIYSRARLTQSLSLLKLAQEGETLPDRIAQYTSNDWGTSSHKAVNVSLLDADSEQPAAQSSEKVTSD